MRIIPAFSEDSEQLTHNRTSQLKSCIVPWWSITVPGIHCQSLRVACMVGVVATTVREIEPTNERDIPRSIIMVADDEELLMMGAKQSHTLIQEHLPASVVDLPTHQFVRSPADRGRYPLSVRSPDKSTHFYSGASKIRKYITDRRTIGQQPLVGVPPPVGKPHTITGLQ
jgi:hypothetical protein